MISASPVALLLAYRYWILFPLAFIEGPIVALIAGLFVSHGELSLLPTYIILCLGDIVPDVLYFGIGRLSHNTNFLKRYGPRFGITSLRLSALEHLWHTHTFKSVLLSKWAYGMSTPLLMTAGLARLPVRKYVIRIIPIAMTQYAILLVIGYYFGSSYRIISTYIEEAGWLVAAGIVIFVIIYFFASRYAKRVLLRDIK